MKIPERNKRGGLRGDLPDFQERPLDFLIELANEHPPLTRVRFGPAVQYVVSDPEGAKTVLQRENRRYIKEQQMMNVTRTVLKSGRNLFTSDGDAWLKRRRTMQPSFHKKMVADFSRVIVTEAEREMKRWEAGRSLDIERAMMATTMGVIGQTMLSRDILADHPALYHAFETASDHIIYRATTISGRLTPSFLPTARNRAFKLAVGEVRRMLSAAVAERQAMPEIERPNDLLTRLMAGRDDESGFTFSSDQLMDELYGIVTAGHETSSITLAAMFYELATHPEIQNRLREEIEAVVGDRLPGPDDLPRLPFLRSVLDETMRRYPAAYVTTREAIEDTELMGFTLPAHGMVMINIYGLHHHHELWHDSMAFDPDRWSRDEINPDAFLPFGAGPRKCIGEPLAQLEMGLIAATILPRWRFEPVDARPMTMEARFTLRAADGIWLKTIPIPQPPSPGKEA